MPIEILENIIIDDSQNLNLTGSAIFGNTVDASGFTINGNPIGNSQTIISNFAPNTSNYSAGTMWWNSSSTDGSLYILYQDPSGPNGDPGGKYWVSATPGIVDLSSYDTSEQVDAKIAAIPSTDLSGYDTSTQVDSKISSSLTDYYTATQVDSKVANDLASYDTSTQVDTKISSNLTSYDTSTQVDNKISNSLLYYDTSSVIDTKIADLVASAPETLNTLGELAIALTGNDSAIDSILATLATKADASSIPTNNNQLTNGAGYITSPDGGNAATLGGVSASVAATNSTIVQRHSSGYIFANYFNTTPNDVTSGVTKVCVETGNDGYIRHGTAAAVRSFLNVADNANYITNNNQLTNGANYITSASVGNGTITITQPGVSNQTFTVNQSGNTTIALRNDNTVPSVGNGTITITQPGVSNQTFTVNQSGNTTIALRNDNTDTNTTYSAASNGGLTLDGTQFKIDFSNLSSI